MKQPTNQPLLDLFKRLLWPHKEPIAGLFGQRSDMKAAQASGHFLFRDALLAARLVNVERRRVLALHRLLMVVRHRTGRLRERRHITLLQKTSLIIRFLRHSAANIQLHATSSHKQAPLL